MIAKKAQIRTNFRRDINVYPRARDAWQAVLESYLEINPEAKVLLPGYIGWTQTEGSGIFDPISNVGLDYDFYRLNKYLRIDIEDLKIKVIENPGAIILLVHYFGFPDDHYKAIINFLNQEKAFYVEDNAHGMLSDWIGGSCGRNGAFSFYSLHKNLPFDEGGLLVNNHTHHIDIKNRDYISPGAVFSFDMSGIFNKRRSNYELLLNELIDQGGISILYPELDEGICPQSFPVLIDEADRDEVFRSMNDKGFGLVSLYYNMIEPLRNYDYDCVQYTSKKITNLPIHQDCNDEELLKMASAFKELL